MSFQYRPACGSLSKAMAEAKTMHTKGDLLQEAKNFYERFLPKGMLTLKKIHVKYYCFDDRIGWHTYIVILEGMGVLGYTNKRVE